jgi:hypothetical protein
MVSIKLGNKTKTPIKLRKCGYSDFPFANVTTIDVLQLTSYSCSNETNIGISGIYSDDVFTYLEYSVTLKKNVLTDKKINDYMKQVFMNTPLKINFYFVDISLAVDDLDNPAKLYINSVTNYMNFNSYQKQNMDFMLLNFTDDGSIILDDPITTSFVKYLAQMTYYYDIDDRMNTTNSDRNLLYKIYIRSNQLVRGVKRDFQKLPTFIANVSGILSNILVIMFVVINFVNEFKLKQSLINKVFNFKDHILNNESMIDKINKIIKESYSRKNSTKKINLKLDHIDSAKESNTNLINEGEEDNKTKLSNSDGFNLNLDINDNFTLSPYKIPNKSKSPVNLGYHTKIPLFRFRHINKLKTQFIKSNPEDKFSYKHAFNKDNYIKDHEHVMNKIPNRKPLEFTYCEMILSWFCCLPKYLRKRKEIYHTGRDKIHYYIDVLTLIKKFQEFDIMKSLIFSKEQRTILSFLSKPIFSLQTSQNKSTQDRRGSFLDDEQDYSNMVFKDSQINEEEIENLYMSYKDLNRKETHDKFDQDLMMRLEKKLFSIVSEY